MKDLVVLVADKNMKFGIDAILSRHNSLNIRSILYDSFIHPLRDPGVYDKAGDFLRQFLREYSYAIVFLDYEGSGQEGKLPDEIANKIRAGLEKNGWQDRAEVFVFNPELEIWIWTESLYTANALGWNSYPELKSWLSDKQVLWQQNSFKPERPKFAMEIALKEKRIPRSSSIYREIAQKVNLDRCKDDSFVNLKDVLRQWFPNEKDKAHPFL